MNDTGAKEIWCVRGRLNTKMDTNSDIYIQKGNGVYSWIAGTVLDLYYDGIQWVVIGDPVVNRIYIDNQTARKNVSITGAVVQAFLL